MSELARARLESTAEVFHEGAGVRFLVCAMSDCPDPLVMPRRFVENVVSGWRGSAQHPVSVTCVGCGYVPQEVVR